MDIFSKKKRSDIMRAVKRKGNKTTELKLIEIFKANEIKGWRRNYKTIGSPDFVFPKARLAVFADGCFWHGHNCRNTKPATNRDYWVKKIKWNRKHDKKVNKELKKRDWKVVRIWECEMKNKAIGGKLSVIENHINQ